MSRGVLVEVDVFNTQNQGGSLQENFKKFRERKLEEARQMKAAQKANPKPQKSEEELRTLFAETAMKYLDVPYSQKYFEPGSPEYDAPLYLDCCALVRQVCRDLEKELGFRIGRWNQSYQYDTLCHALIRKEELRKGDLVFTRAKYRSADARQQIHDMVHVEIYLGDGKTLGSRSTDPAKPKKVMVHDDMSEYYSTSYEEQVYEYASIAPWLQGDCTSHCAEHQWLPCGPALGAGEKKSIFFEEEDELAE